MIARIRDGVKDLVSGVGPEASATHPFAPAGLPG